MFSEKDETTDELNSPMSRMNSDTHLFLHACLVNEQAEVHFMSEFVDEDNQKKKKGSFRKLTAS